VQEALTNTAKHSGAKHATVRMTFTSYSLTVSVHDDGRGFNAPKTKAVPGLGHIAMQERAEIVHGTLRISSTPEGGTTVVITMPLQQDEALLNGTQTQRLEEVTSGS
jgi:signal transduction histidine kinase